jgi:hypothetical protein
MAIKNKVMTTSQKKAGVSSGLPEEESTDGSTDTGFTQQEKMHNNEGGVSGVASFSRNH